MNFCIVGRGKKKKVFVHLLLMAFQILLVSFLLLGFALSKIITVLVHSYAIGTVKDDPWKVLTIGWNAIGTWRGYVMSMVLAA